MTSRVLNIEVNDRGFPLTMRGWGISVWRGVSGKGFRPPGKT